jgi:hypothetical protein
MESHSHDPKPSWAQPCESSRSQLTRVPLGAQTPQKDDCIATTTDHLDFPSRTRMLSTRLDMVKCASGKAMRSVPGGVCQSARGKRFEVVNGHTILGARTSSC